MKKNITPMRKKFILWSYLQVKIQKIQGVKNVRNSEQIIKNLLYVMLMNSAFFSAFFTRF